MLKKSNINLYYYKFIKRGFMKKLNYLIVLFFTSFLLFSSCSDDESIVDKVEYTLTESLFTSASNSIQTNINNGNMAHNGNAEMSGNETFRDVFTNLSNVNSKANPGDIVTKYVYGKDENNGKGSLQVAFAMVKQMNGFGDEHGNWYWYIIPADQSGNLNFDSITLVANQSDCSGCHSGAGEENDYRFVYAY